MFGIVTAEINNISVFRYNLRAALSEGGGRMWPPGRQLPMYALSYRVYTIFSANLS